MQIVITQIDDLTSDEMVKKGFNHNGYMTESLKEYFSPRREETIAEKAIEILAACDFNVFDNYYFHQIFNNSINFETYDGRFDNKRKYRKLLRMMRDASH